MAKLTTQPLWQEKISKHSFSSLNENIGVEVCIVGGGIAGLSIAYRLLTAGQQVIVLESKQIGGGETGNTSAHLSNALDDRYYQIEKMHGKDKAKLAAESHSKAIDWIEAVIKKEHIHCDFQRIPGYLFNTSERSLAKEYAAAKRAGLKVTYSKEPILGQVLNFPNQARFHPQKYIQGLARAITNIGGKIYEDSTVTKIDFKKNQIILKNHKIVSAKNIVTATNAPLFGNLNMHFKLNPQRTYIIGLKIPKNAIKDALYWDNENPYHYVRLDTQFNEYDILIVGGEDHRVGRMSKNSPFVELKKWAQRNFKLDTPDIAYQWSGQVLEPVDYMAYIGQHPKSKNTFMVTGDSGNGLTHGTLAANIITDLILKNNNSYQKLYDSQRKLPWRAIKNYFTNISASALAYLRYFIPQRDKTLAIGEGKIIQDGFKKIAIYRENEHQIKQCSGICSHLKGVLQWNPIEKTWDCSAHGSRFDLDGNFINGPTCQELNK
jgi:glycine/D-amino acid oxidase-like deaminating enzyme/nitrite reductase/ring-hydroxylating ferredoxin subunit